MKNVILLLSFLFISFNSFAWQKDKIDYSEFYKKYIEPDSKLIIARKGLTVEKTKDGKYVRKTYSSRSTRNINSDVNIRMNSSETFKNKKLTKFDGISKYWTLNGASLVEGFYKKGRKEGDWKFYYPSGNLLKTKGKYINGKKEGEWIEKDREGDTTVVYFYKKGVLEFDKTKRLKEEILVDVEEEIQFEKVRKVVEVMPRYQGCENVHHMLQRIKCAEGEMMKFIYGNLQYPPSARKNRIQGRVILQFVITKFGKVRNIKVLRAPSEELGIEATRVVKLMTKWNPGEEGGKLMDVEYTLPISFRLH